MLNAAVMRSAHDHKVAICDCPMVLSSDVDCQVGESVVYVVAVIDYNSHSGAKCELSPSMSEEQFFTLLREESLPDDDCKILRGN